MTPTMTITTATTMATGAAPGPPADYDHGLDPDRPLSRQAPSLAAELEACRVFQKEALARLYAGDLRALATLGALEDHAAQLAADLHRVEHPTSQP